MKYFINHPSACRLYAKCYGWQETLAHFFVKIRRSSVAHVFPYRSSSQDILSPSTKDQSLDSSHESSNLLNSSDPTKPTFDITINPDDSLSEKQIDNKDFSSYSNDRIITPPLSIVDSREDLLSSLKTENSNENLLDMRRFHSDPSSPLPRSTTNTSTKQTDYQKENNPHYTEIISELKKVLG